MAGSVKIIGGSKNQTLDLKIAQFVLTTTTILTVDLERAQNFQALGFIGFWFWALAFPILGLEPVRLLKALCYG